MNVNMDKEKLSPMKLEDEIAERGEEQEQPSMEAVAGVLGELKALQSETWTAWSDTLRRCADALQRLPVGSRAQQQCFVEDASKNPTTQCLTSLSDTLVSAGEDLDKVLDNLREVILKLDTALLQLPPDDWVVESALHKPEDAEESVQLEACSRPNGDSGCVESEQSHNSPSLTNEDTDDSTVTENSGTESQTPNEEKEFVEELIHSDVVSAEETEERREEIHKVKKQEWTLLGITALTEESVSEACFIRAPADAAKDLRCEAADALSCLMVSESEELLSRVIRVEVLDRARISFPVSVGVPYHVPHHSQHREIAVKLMEKEQRMSYISPTTSETELGEQKVSFAEVKVYCLGLFAVVSRVKKETYMIPMKGLSMVSSVDSHISLKYLSGTFTAPVMAQMMVLPMDPALLSTVKCRNETYKPVVSTSPLLYLTHPTSQPLKRPLTVSLSYFPDPVKKRDRGFEKNQNQHCSSTGASLVSLERVRVPESILKYKDMINETIAVLGFKDKRWKVLDKVSSSGQRSDVVTFDLMENFERLLAVRIIAELPPGHLTSLAEDLEGSAFYHAVRVVLLRQQDDPQTVLVAVLPSQEFSRELSKMQSQGYSGAVVTSSEIYIEEANQLHIRFSGNITSTDLGQNNKNNCLTFHRLQKNQLLVQISEVNPNGNCKSPHYKGTVLLYKVTRQQLERSGNKAVLRDSESLGDPICTLPLTLPKKGRKLNRPVLPKIRSREDAEPLSDALLLWLSEQLSQRETSLLESSLHPRYSNTPRVKFQAGGNPSAQAFHVLSMWKKALPAAQYRLKSAHLAQCLVRCGRADLAGELRRRQEEIDETRRVKM